MLGLSFSSEYDSGSCLVSITKTTYKKIEVLICSIKFLSSDVDFVFTNLP